MGARVRAATYSPLSIQLPWCSEGTGVQLQPPGNTECMRLPWDGSRIQGRTQRQPAGAHARLVQGARGNPGLLRAARGSDGEWRLSTRTWRWSRTPGRFLDETNPSKCLLLPSALLLWTSVTQPSAEELQPQPRSSSSRFLLSAQIAFAAQVGWIQLIGALQRRKKSPQQVKLYHLYQNGPRIESWPWKIERST